MTTKLKCLCWSDAATAGTGFGVVSKYILSALHETGKYEIHHLAINFHGDFVDRQQVPWQVQPARLLDPRDPHGMQMFRRTLQQTDYDIVWVLNDLYVTHEIADVVASTKQRARSKGLKPPIFIYYYPVDCSVKAEGSGFLHACDVPVAYTHHGREETLKLIPDLKGRLFQIPHGVNSKVFHPEPKEIREKWRQQYVGAKPDTKVVVAVNRNNTRKQLPYSFLAFREFKKYYPNSIMYCHTAMRDQGGDLSKVLDALSFSAERDIIFPAKYSATNPVPDALLNQMYNIGDLFLTTHLGEGWGLTVTEAMAAGTPVVAPNNTCMPQQLGDNSERGYMYPCKDLLCIDNSGFRKKGLIPDIVKAMVDAVEMSKEENHKIIAAREWAMQHDWEHVVKDWVNLFQKAEQLREATRNMMAEDV